MAKHKVKNKMLQVVRTPVFRPRVEKDRTKYNRNNKHKSRGYDLVYFAVH